MITGFYNTVLKTENGRKYFKYQVNNKIVKKEIKKKDILILKKTVEELGLLWGIYDLELANQFKGDYDLKELTGRYGLQCQD